MQRATVTNSLKIALAATVIALSCSFSLAHRAVTGQDYTKYRQRNGMSCCSGHDCRPAKYEIRKDGTIVMFPDGRAVVIPADRVNQLPSDDGLGHWCGLLNRDGSATTFCAILPSRTAQSSRIRTAQLEDAAFAP
ncbi:MAG TPA: hypothetical protein VG900_01250 [Hyphomicrobiaceae bacterium]|nr:hypothetical protein [Hyphomicrobiaceae bacterium]